jgi:hypothetical protein
MADDVNDLKRQLEALRVSRKWIDDYLTDPVTHEPLRNEVQKERLGILVNRIQAYSGSIEAQRKAVDLYASQSTLDELRKAAENGTAPNEALRKYFETLKAEADQILAGVNAKAATQKVGRILKETMGIDIEKNPDELEKLAEGGKDSQLYKILSTRADLSAAELDAFNKAIQGTAGTKKSIQDAIAAAAQAKRAVVEADAIARKFAPTLAKVGIGDGPGLESFSAAIKDGSLMERVEKLTTMVGQDGLTLKDVQEITQTARGLLEAHKIEATMAADIARANAEAKSTTIGANLLASLVGDGTHGIGGMLSVPQLLYGQGQRFDHILDATATPDLLGAGRGGLKRATTDVSTTDVKAAERAARKILADLGLPPTPGSG